MDSGIQLNASIRLYEDDPMDAVIIQWLNSMPLRQEKGASRDRVCRRGIMRDVRQALYEYAKKQNGRRANDPRKGVSQKTAPAPPAQPDRSDQPMPMGRPVGSPYPDWAGPAASADRPSLGGGEPGGGGGGGLSQGVPDFVPRVKF